MAVIGSFTPQSIERGTADDGLRATLIAVEGDGRAVIEIGILSRSGCAMPGHNSRPIPCEEQAARKRRGMPRPAWHVR